LIRDHKPTVIQKFNGLWARGDELTCPETHFTDCQNLQFFTGGFRTRDGIAPYQSEDEALPDAIRIYNYKTQDAEGLLVLTTGGNIYHVIGPDTVYGPILTLTDMTDFGFTQIAGRAYITPFATYQDDLGKNYQKGLEDEFLYVYLGEGADARKAAGPAPTGVGFTAVNSATSGFTDAGFHIFAVVYETDTGYLTAPGPAIFATLTTLADKRIDLSSIPVSPDSYVTKRHIIATKVVVNYNGDQTGYQFFFVPTGTIEDNVSTTKSISFYDFELLEDASYLLYNLAEIPAGVALTTYHGRLVLGATFEDESLVMVSQIGEPEAISELDGYVIFPLDSYPITNAQEFRDILYLFKMTKTGAVVDNGGEPSTWPFQFIDQGAGTSVHGIAKVLDSEGININFLIIAAYSGILLFNGSYSRPDLTYNIENYWLDLDRNEFHKLHFANDSVSAYLYTAMPDGSLLFADYTEGLNLKNIKWCPWVFDGVVSTVALVETNKLVIGIREEEE